MSAEGTTHYNLFDSLKTGQYDQFFEGIIKKLEQYFVELEAGPASGVNVDSITPQAGLEKIIKTELSEPRNAHDLYNCLELLNGLMPLLEANFNGKRNQPDIIYDYGERGNKDGFLTEKKHALVGNVTRRMLDFVYMAILQLNHDAENLPLSEKMTLSMIRFNSTLNNTFSASPSHAVIPELVCRGLDDVVYDHTHEDMSAAYEEYKAKPLLCPLDLYERSLGAGKNQNSENQKTAFPGSMISKVNVNSGRNQSALMTVDQQASLIALVTAAISRVLIAYIAAPLAYLFAINNTAKAKPVSMLEGSRPKEDRPDESRFNASHHSLKDNPSALFARSRKPDEIPAEQPRMSIRSPS